MEATKILDVEFKTMVIRMLKDLRGTMDDISDNLKQEIISIEKDIETINTNQSEIKNTISEVKNTLEGINSRFDEAENQISELENKITVSTQAEHQKERRI